MKKTILMIAALLSLQAAAQDRTELRLDIDRCREMALSNNSSTLNTRLDVRAAEYQKQEAAAEYLPRINFMSVGFQSLNPMLKIGIKDILGNNDLSNNLQGLVDSYAAMYGITPYYSALQNGYGASVSVMQPLYAGGRIVTGNRLASLGLEAAQLQGKVQARKTEEETDGLYWQVVTLEEKLKTVTEFKEMLDTLCKDAESAYRAGLMTENDLLQARLKRNELRTSEVKLRNGIRLSRMNLLNAIGQRYSVVRGSADDDRPYLDDFIIGESESAPQSPEGLYVDEERIAASMEEARLLALNVEAKRLEKRMELGNTLPQLAVGASYGYSRTIGDGRFNGMAFATLKIPISDWWKTSRKLNRLQVQVDKAQNEKDQLDKQVLLLVRKYWLDLNSAWDEYNLALESVQMARTSLDNTRSHYDAGLVPISELLKAQASLQQAEDGAVDACTAYRKVLRIWQDISYLCSSEN